MPWPSTLRCAICNPEILIPNLLYLPQNEERTNTRPRTAPEADRRTLEDTVETRCLKRRRATQPSGRLVPGSSPTELQNAHHRFSIALKRQSAALCPV